MIYLEEKGAGKNSREDFRGDFRKDFREDFINAMKDGRVKIVPIEMDSNKIGEDIDFHNAISNMIKENKVPKDLAMGLKRILNIGEQVEQEKKSEISKEGILSKDVMLNESVTIPKGTEYKVLEKIDETNIKVSFATYVVSVLGTKSINSNLEIVMPVAFYKEHIAPKITYLKELNSLTDSELNCKIANLDGSKVSYIRKEDVVKSLMKEYNLYKQERVTVDDIIKNNLSVDYNLLDKAMLSLGYICIGEEKNIYIK